MPGSTVAQRLGGTTSNQAIGLKAVNYALYEVGKGNYSIISRSDEAHGRIQDRLGPLRGVAALKCNILVYDALQSAGAPPGLISGRIPLAEEWGNPRTPIAGYPAQRILTIPAGGLDRATIAALRDGDVISDGHHVGLVTLDRQDGADFPKTVSAASPAKQPPYGEVVVNDWGFRAGQHVTIRRSLNDIRGKKRQ